MWSSGRTGVVRLLLLAFAGCAAGSGSLGSSDASKHFTPPEALPEGMAARGMSGRELVAAYPSPARTALGYTPSKAEHMDCLQRSRAGSTTTPGIALMTSYSCRPSAACWPQC